MSLTTLAPAPRPARAQQPVRYPPPARPATSDTPPDARHWIGGAWRSSATILESVNPATNAVLGTFASAGVEEAQAAIAAARAAFDTTDWARSPEVRARALSELADRFEERKDELSRLLTRENGKLLSETAWEVAGSISWLRYSAAAALTLLTGEAIHAPDGALVTSLREPRGVAGVISPWNSPILLTIRSLGPALAAGCTAVVKLPGHTGLTNGLFAEAVAATAAFPAGVINVFTDQAGDGAKHVVSSPDVDVIAFTGSTQTGRAIAAECAKTIKPVSLELGGKTPLIVFDDADPAAVVPFVLTALLRMNGQFCCTGSRLLVHRAVADRIRDALVPAFEAVRVGSPEDPASELGPVVNAEGVERLDGLVQEASAYAKVLVRGGPVTEGPLAGAAYFRPTLLEVAQPDVPVVQQELFGPVLVMEVFDDEADAIRRANATEYGLAASVFSNDRARARRVSRALQAGLIWINTWGPLPADFPAGGHKQSGIGLAGPTGVEEFQHVKVYSESA